MMGSFSGLLASIEEERRPLKAIEGKRMLEAYFTGNGAGHMFADRERIYDKAHEYISAMRRAVEEAPEPVAYVIPYNANGVYWEGMR